MDIPWLTSWLGWMAVMNMGFLLFSSLFVMMFRGWILRFHARFFAMTEQQVAGRLYLLLGQYKIAIFLLNIVPWLALNILLKSPS